MSNWTGKHIQQLQKDGKIRGYNMPPKSKNYSSNGKPITIPREKPKGLIWLEWNLEYWCNKAGFVYKREYQFYDQRDWRSDFAILSPDKKFLVEYEGGIFMQRGAHNSPGAIHRDIEKYQMAAKLGFTVIRVTALTYTTVLKTLNDLVK